MIRRSTWILLAVFALGLALVFYTQKNPGVLGTTGTPTATAMPKLAFDLPWEVVTSITYIDAQGGKLELRRNVGGAWELAGAPQDIVNQGAVMQAYTSLTGLSTLNSLDPATQLEALGLSAQSQSITLKDAANHQQVLHIGDQAPTGSGYYVQLDAAPPVVVSRYALEDVLQNLKPENIKAGTPAPQGEQQPVVPTATVVPATPTTGATPAATATVAPQASATTQP